MDIDWRRRGLLRGVWRDATAPRAPSPLRPPWALPNDAEFRRRCTRCDDCVRACPRHLIMRGDGGYPELAFIRGGCDLCGACLRACTPHALEAQPNAPALPARAQITESCLALRRVECRICVEACAVAALRVEPASDGIGRIALDASRCNGCGECVAVCPTAAVAMQLPR